MPSSQKKVADDQNISIINIFYLKGRIPKSSELG